MIPGHLLFSGEWQTRFDPQVTSKGAFYLDNQNSVLVDMMKSAQYPLRLLHDPELEAQVAPPTPSQRDSLMSDILWGFSKLLLQGDQI